jgi:hypothetical protein
MLEKEIRKLQIVEFGEILVGADSAKFEFTGMTNLLSTYLEVHIGMCLSLFEEKIKNN